MATLQGRPAGRGGLLPVSDMLSLAEVVGDALNDAHSRGGVRPSCQQVS